MEIQTKIRALLHPLLVLAYLTLAVFILTVAWLVIVAPGQTGASSHREAPLIAQDPYADVTDVYAFVSPDNKNTVTLIASWIPFEHPDGGPNFYRFADDVLYQLHVSNDGDADAEITYQFRFNTTTSSPNTFLYNTGSVNSPDDGDLNIKQSFKVTEIHPSGTETSGSLRISAVNIGNKSTPNYDSAIFKDGIREVNLNGANLKVFAGQTDDPFFVDLNVFDLLSLRTQPAPIGYGTTPTPSVDGLCGYNVHSIAIQVPINHLKNGGGVLGIWATSSRQSIRNETGQPTGGSFKQVARLAMPLVNEVVLPLGLKDVFNSIPPSTDLSVYGALQESVEDPELGNLLCGLYDVPLPGDNGKDCDTDYSAGTPRTGRGDIFDIFIQGMVLTRPFTITTQGGSVALPAGFNVNRPAGVVPAEMIRLNTAISGTLCAPTPSRLGILGGDACGFPNGRRLADDVTDIELLAVAGAAYGVLDARDSNFKFNSGLIGVLDDGVPFNDKEFGDSFPYLASPHQGQNHINDCSYVKGTLVKDTHHFPIIIKDGP